MKKQILLALDDSRRSRYALQYAVRMGAAIRDLHYVLLHVQPAVSQFLLEEAKRSRATRMELSRLIEKNTRAAAGMLDRCKEEMVRLGVPEGKIESVTRPRRRGLAKDVIDISESVPYDAVVVGRRGLTRLQETFLGSVSNNLVEHSRVIPVWVVDGEVRSSSILVAVDGSKSADRAVDHVSFMLGHNPDIRVTLLQVTGNGRSDRSLSLDSVGPNPFGCRDLEAGQARAVEKLKEVGIGEDQIELRVVKSRSNPGKSITYQAKKDHFGTVVVGRSGSSSAFFMGSASRYVIHKTSNRALWVVS